MSRRSTTRCGVALLEVMLAIAMLAMAGLVVLGALSDASRRLRSAEIRADAADLAASAFALLNAGLATPDSLDGPVPADGLIGNDGASDSAAAGDIEPSGWMLVVDTEPAAFDGRVRVQITVARTDASGETQDVLTWTDVTPSAGGLSGARSAVR